MVSMVLNVVLNIILIKKFGVHGAVAASFISYVACYIIRVIDARRYIYFKVDHTKTVMNLSILLGNGYYSRTSAGILYSPANRYNNIYNRRKFPGAYGYRQKNIKR